MKSGIGEGQNEHPYSRSMQLDSSSANVKLIMHRMSYKEVAMLKSVIITLRVTPETKATAQRLADREGRSLSNYVEQLITHAMEAERKKRKR
jgi:predicted HicB family RNase H-like nuclease